MLSIARMRVAVVAVDLLVQVRLQSATTQVRQMSYHIIYS